MAEDNRNETVGRSRSAARLLLGLTGAGSDQPGAGGNQRSLQPRLVATHRLRVVAVGALISIAGLVNLVIYMLLPGHNISVNGFIVVLFLGLCVLGGLVLTPWNKILTNSWGLRALYGWSVLGLVEIGVAVYLDGGGDSVMYMMFPVLIVFFAIAYPQAAQALLFLLAVAIYTVAIAAHGWQITAGSYYIRIATLLVMAYVASVLSSWLITEMADRARSSSTAEQRAGMLDTVARAARRVSSLDASHILSGALTGAMELGCHEAEVWLLEGEPAHLQLQRRTAQNATPPNSQLALQLYDQARIAGATQIVEADHDRVVVCLLHREGEATGVLLARLSAADSSDALVIDCIELLAAQVSTGLDVARNVAERRGLEERLAHWAFHDSLTDLPNRVLFADRLELALARTARDGSHVAVLFLDLDGFKGINDTLGHAVGDELLHSVADRLHSCLRPNDTLARYGGDEFVVLVEQVEGPQFAALVAQRILDALNRTMIVGGHELLVKTSIGIALAGARPGADSDVLRRADIAMYQAKAAGGARYVLSPSLETEIEGPLKHQEPKPSKPNPNPSEPSEASRSNEEEAS